MKSGRLLGGVYGVCSFILVARVVCAQGSLAPPGAPGPTMKTLDQAEPRLPVWKVPTNITVSGSYYATRDLVGTTALNGITISADDVSLDLKGFSLVGVPGSVNGILLSGIHSNLVVRDGTIGGWGACGIQAATLRNGRFERLAVSGNTGPGLTAGESCLVRDCTAYDNGGDGIGASLSCLVLDCTANANDGNGIAGGNNCVVRDCVANGNGRDGIYLGVVGMVRDCLVQNSSSNGIVVALGAYVSGCLSQGNAVDGIRAGTFAHVVNNATANNAIGIHFTGAGGRADENTCVSEGVGIRDDSGGVSIIRNTAQTYSAPTDVLIGPTNLVPSTATSPWANF